LSIFLTVTVPPPSSSYNDFCDHVRSIQAIQDNLSPERQQASNHHLITPCHFQGSGCAHLCGSAVLPTTFTHTFTVERIMTFMG
jgi:hypothetical protein